MSGKVLVIDACAIIDLKRGQLLDLLPYLPHRLEMLKEVRAELMQLTQADWSMLDRSGLQTLALSAKDEERAKQLRSRNPQLSASDRACLVAAQLHSGNILLTNDRQLRRAAEKMQAHAHGTLWIIDQLKAIRDCPVERLCSALKTWRDDVSVYLPEDEIDRRLKRFEQTNKRPPKSPASSRT